MRHKLQSMHRSIAKVVTWGFCLIAIFSCSQKPPEELTGPPAFERVAAHDIPTFDDDLDTHSLRTAVEKSLSFYDRVPGDRTYPLGQLQVRADRLKESLLLFQQLLNSNRLDSSSVGKFFDIYMVRSKTTIDPMLVTGYFEPVLEGRLESDADFCYPLYGVPPDLLTIELSAFDPGRFSPERLIGRVQGNRVVPYYTRGEIDGQKRLDNAGSQLVWLRDPVDAFFLHVQGSGMIQLPGGKNRRLGYAGTNGRPYRSIGKYLIEKGAISSEEMSLQSIRAYLRTHPEVMDDVLRHNESYVFFRWIEEGPLGSLNVPLTSGRSIASDPQHHPRGAIAFLETKKPRLSANGEVTDWEPLHRWVLNQDVGGAIKGVGRVDLFCGSGEPAEWMAGRLKHPGKLYVLLKKEEAGK